MGVKLRAAEIERNDPVGILKIHPVERMMERSLEPDCDEFIEVHAAIAIGLEELRFDDRVRVIVITGSQDDVVYVAPARSHHDVEKYRRRLEGIIAPEKTAETRPSEVRARYRRTGDYVEQLLFCEKPIIEQWNLQMDLAWAYEHLDFVQHGLLGRSAKGWTPELSAEMDIGDGEVGRPTAPYSDQSGITERS